MLASLARACVRHRWIVIGAVGRAAGRRQRRRRRASAPTTAPTSRCPTASRKEVQELLEADDPEPGRLHRPDRRPQAEQGIDDPAVQATLEDDLRTSPTSRPASPSPARTTTPQQISEDGTIAFAQLDVARPRLRGGRRTLGNEIEDFGDDATRRRGPRDRVRRRPLRRVRAARERDPRHHRRRHHPDPRLRLGAGHGPADRHRPVRPRHRLGARVAGSHVITMPDFTTAMVAMIGLGVGIDYALFIVTRYREGLRLGLDVEDSRRRGDGHQRAGRAVRRHHRDHLADGPVPDRAQLRAGRRPRLARSACC